MNMTLRYDALAHGASSISTRGGRLSVQQEYAVVFSEYLLRSDFRGEARSMIISLPNEPIGK
jgi:hypothetical protein